MQQNVENARLYMPAEDPTKPNERTVMHPETNADQVIMGADGQTLREHLGLQVTVSAEDPKKEGLWAQITATRV